RNSGNLEGHRAWGTTKFSSGGPPPAFTGVGPFFRYVYLPVLRWELSNSPFKGHRSQNGPKLFSLILSASSVTVRGGAPKSVRSSPYIQYCALNESSVNLILSTVKS